MLHLRTVMRIAERRAIPVVEDNAHGLFGKYKGRNLGTFGCLSTLSFHETKNFTTLSEPELARVVEALHQFERTA